MESNNEDSRKYEVIYNQALELLEKKYPDWSSYRLSTAAHLYVTIMLAIAITDERQQKVTQ